jgi:hypothetical protein
MGTPTNAGSCGHHAPINPWLGPWGAANNLEGLRGLGELAEGVVELHHLGE